MGFMSETITVVGSSAYNLAGDPKQRGRYLKNVVVGSTMANTKNGLGMDIFTSHINGPGTDLVNFAKWAEKSNYNEQVGFPVGRVYSNPNIGNTVFNQIYTPPAGREASFLASVVAGATYEYLAESHIAENYPERVGQPFKAAPETKKTTGYRSRTYLTGNIVITFTTDNTQVVFTPPVSIMEEGVVVYFYYKERDIIPSQVIEGDWETVSSPDDFPSLDHFVFINGESVISNVTHTLTKTTIVLTEYSDSRPDETTATTDDSTTVKEHSYLVYERNSSEPAPAGELGVRNIEERRFLDTQWSVVSLDPEVTVEVIDVEPGITATVTTTVVKQEVVPTYRHKLITTISTAENWEEKKAFTYLKGTNEYFDNLIFNNTEQTTGVYLPIIPLRTHNRAVNATNYPAQYALNKQAAKKVFKNSKKLDTILKQLESSDSIEDIDHAWIVFGCALGTNEQEGIAYIFQFFKDWADSSIHNPVAVATADEYAIAMHNYWVALENYEKYSSSSDGWTGVRPTLPTLPTVNNFTFATYTATTRFGWFAKPPSSPWNYNIKITAKGGHKTVGFGMHARANNKVGHCWIYYAGDVSIPNRETHQTDDGGYEHVYKNVVTSKIKFGRQTTEDFWEEYEFFEILHTNYVYENLTVTVNGKEALNSGEGSSFIIPLNIEVLKNMNLIKRTQMAMGAYYMVINYYDRQKVPWYATGLFQVVFVVVVVVVSIYTGGAASGGTGVLGSNAAVGATIGLAGTAAIVAGAILNALSAAIIAAVISKVSTRLLGDQLGAIVGAIVSMVVVWGASNNWNFNTTDLMQSFTKADNLLKLTVASADVMSKYMKSQMDALIAGTADMLADYKAQSEEIAEMATKYLAHTGIDPMVISEATRTLVESPEQFMGRTLMTGDDIVQTTIDLVERFPEPQLKLPYME